MARHLFLTGDKHVGKSTFLQKALTDFPRSPGGFYTVRTRTFLKDSYSVHLYQAGMPQVPSAENLLFSCRPSLGDVSSRFNLLGCQALRQSKGCSLLVLDELGPHEAEADTFRENILSLLDGKTPVFGVLQAPAADFWPEILSHPEVLLLHITKENRCDEALIRWIRSFFSNCDK